MESNSQPNSPPQFSKGLMTWPNIQFFSLIGPYVLIGFFVLLSIFNTNLKGIMYLIGLIIMLFFTNILELFLPKEDNLASKAMCNAFGLSPLLSRTLPFGILVYAYTFTYLFIPMLETSMMNYPLLMFLMMILGTDISIQRFNSCYKLPSIMLSIISGIVVGISWSLIVNAMSPSLRYHTDYISDKKVCSMPSEQKFKCKVYKNGQLISSMTQ